MLNLFAPDVRQSAGLLFLKGHKILVLKRSKRTRNGGKWGLPGGRIDQDESWYRAARRESAEELKTVPEHGIVGSITVHRSHRLYAIFACRGSKKALGSWQPELNHEHDDWRWVNYAWIRAHQDKLHPVLQRIIVDKTGRKWIRSMMKQRTQKPLHGGRLSTDQ